MEDAPLDTIVGVVMATDKDGDNITYSLNSTGKYVTSTGETVNCQSLDYKRK